MVRESLSPLQPVRAKLSPSQHECLHLYWLHEATALEIGRQLAIARSTVDSYLAEAVHLLGATDRRDAALRVFGPFPTLASGHVDPPPTGREAAWRPPFRGGRRNTLTVPARLFWIVALALSAAIGFGALANAVQMIDQLCR